ncbi:hypothetical protein ACLOJK_007619 [Asimina triloba]
MAKSNGTDPSFDHSIRWPLRHHPAVESFTVATARRRALYRAIPAIQHAGDDELTPEPLRPQTPDNHYHIHLYPRCTGEPAPSASLSMLPSSSSSTVGSGPIQVDNNFIESARCR